MRHVAAEEARPAADVTERTGPEAAAVADSMAESGAHHRLTPKFVGWTTVAVLVVVLVLENRYIFTEHRYEDGDFAANSILIDQARHFRLLVGNYSRVGFNHPGPALLYVQAFSQLAFHDVLPLIRSPYGAHVLGIILLDAAMIGLAAAVVQRRTRSLVGVVILVVTALVSSSVEPGLLSSTWMPHVYPWPFLLLLVSATSVVSGGSRDVWMVALAGGLLVHGHVSFVMFVGVIGSVVALSLVVRRVRRRRNWGLDGRSLSATVALLALFALPIVVNLVLHWPGELRKYRAYSSTGAGQDLPDVLHFVRLYWGHARWASVLAAALLGVTVLLAWRSASRLRAFVVTGAGFVVLATVLLVVYAMRGVDDLAFRYVGVFYFAVPILLAVLVGVTVADRLGALPFPSWARHPAPAWLGVGVIAALVLVSSQPRLTNPYPGAAWLPTAYSAVESQAPDGMIALRFDTPAWPVAAGIVEQARRDGREVCVVDNQALAVLFTTRVMCTPDQLAQAHSIGVKLGSAPPAAGEFFADPFVRLAPTA